MLCLVVKVDNKFYSKIAKSVSEFMILAILKEKGESYTYEIQQTLFSKFSIQKIHSAKIMNILTDLNETTNISIAKNKFHEQTINHLNRIESNLVLGTTKELLHNLQYELEIIMDHIFFPVKIWDTVGAIYQVMKELEEQGFIEVSRSEIVNGRTRKIFNITAKGELEAIRMIFIFNSVISSIYPQFLIFSKNIQQFFTNHINTLNSLFKRIIENEESNLINLNEIKKHMEKYKRLNPFSEDQFNMIIQLLSINDYNQNDIIKIFSLNDKIQNSEIITMLNNYKQKLENLLLISTQFYEKDI